MLELIQRTGHVDRMSDHSIYDNNIYWYIEHFTICVDAYSRGLKFTYTSVPMISIAFIFLWCNVWGNVTKPVGQTGWQTLLHVQLRYFFFSYKLPKTLTVTSNGSMSLDVTTQGMWKASDDMEVPTLDCVTHKLQLAVHLGLLSQHSITDWLAKARKM